MKFVILVGASGSGKTYIKEYLCNNLRHTYIAVPQFTTRQKRTDEADIAYLFVTKNAYDNIDKFLIGRTKIYDICYGSMFPAKDLDLIYTVILNEQGLKDFITNIDTNHHQFNIIGITRNDLVREGRTAEYIESEKNVLKYANVVFDGKDGYVSVSEVHNYIQNLKWGES
jgi:cytidylate kinase